MSALFGPVIQQGYVVPDIDVAIEHWVARGIGPFSIEAHTRPKGSYDGVEIHPTFRHRSPIRAISRSRSSNNTMTPRRSSATTWLPTPREDSSISRCGSTASPKPLQCSTQPVAGIESASATATATRIWTRRPLPAS